MSKSSLRPRKADEFIWCTGFLDIVWPDFGGRPKEFERIQAIIIESKYSASSKHIQELCGILQDYPDHIKQYAVSFIEQPRQLTLPDDYPQTAVFDYTNLQGQTRKLASFGLSSDESSSRDHKILRLIMNTLVNPQVYEPALLELVGPDALRTLKVMNDLVTNGPGSWVRFAERYKFLHQYTPGTSDMWRVRRLKCRLHVRSNDLPRSLVKTVTAGPDKREVVSGPFLLCKGQLSNALGLNTQVYIQKPRLRTKFGTNPGHAERVKRIFLQQCIVWSDLRHKNLNSLLGVDSAAALTKQSVITQSLNMKDRIGDLTYWRKNVPVSKWILQILDGLSYLHSQGIVHGILQSSNILIDSQDRVVLTEFGMYSLPDACRHSDRIPAPEVVKAVRNTWRSDGMIPIDSLRPSVDMYAFATVCVEAYTGRCATFCEECWRRWNLDPPSELPHSDSLRKVECPQVPSTGRIPDIVLHEMRRCWSVDSALRPTASDLHKGLTVFFRGR